MNKDLFIKIYTQMKELDYRIAASHIKNNITDVIKLAEPAVNINQFIIENYYGPAGYEFYSDWSVFRDQCDDFGEVPPEFLIPALSVPSLNNIHTPEQLWEYMEKTYGPNR